MTDKKKKTEEKAEEQKKSGKLFKAFLLITLIFVVGIYMVIQNRPDLVERIYPNKTANTNEESVDQELIKEALEDSYSVGPEPPVLEFDSEKESEEQDINSESTEPDSESGDVIEVEESLDPYEEIVEKEAKAFDGSALKSKFNEYRIFLSNANSIITKFNAGDNYDFELKSFKKHIHPSHINEIVKLLESYGSLQNKLVNSDEEEVDSIQAKLLAKFVKIRKTDPVDSEFLNIKSKIDERLDIFTNYLYSQSLQDSLVK